MKRDLQKKGYLYDPERFADLINGVVCSGKRIVRAQQLTDMDSQTGFFGGKPGHRNLEKQKKQRYRDLIRKAAFGVNFMVVGIENQEEVHYLMPLRSMLYDAAEYERQAMLIRRRVKKCKDVTSAEFLSGFTKMDRLRPCITLILYYGEDWDGARDLYGILDFTDIPQELREKVNNYCIYVCEVRKLENTDVFQTDIKQVFDCIRYAENPEKLRELVMSDPAYRELDEDTYDVIAEYTKTTELMKVKSYGREGDKINMCGAIEKLIQDGRMEGLNQGIEQGIEQGAKALIETCTELGSMREETLERLMTKLHIPRENAEEYMKKYW